MSEDTKMNHLVFKFNLHYSYRYLPIYNGFVRVRIYNDLHIFKTSFWKNSLYQTAKNQNIVI